MRTRGVTMAYTSLLAATLTLTTACAHTGAVRGTSGAPLALKVSSRESVQLNGTTQWIYLAGASPSNPVLLWLDGGPGGSEVGTVRRYLGPLHEHFTVVCWDQRGTGRSRRAVRDWNTVSVEEYVDDVLDLSAMLARRFGKESIYLVGHSWGSIIGLRAASREPGLFAAYIGVAQQVNAGENDTIGWNMIKEGARAEGKEGVVRKLESFGPPPYRDGDECYYLLSRLYHYSPEPPGGDGFDSTWYFRAPEHRLGDRLGVLTGLLNGVKHVYPLLADLDFEREVTALECQLFIAAGRYDFSCVATIAARWFDGVSAPVKEFAWFDRSGHNPCYEEPEAFMRFLIGTVLPAVKAGRS